MKTNRKILIAFLLNLSFSVFEFIGSVFTGSVAIASDAIHDIVDAGSIGASYWFEIMSKKQPDEKYTYGYTRYSVIGGFITALILLISSAFMIVNAVSRIIVPVEINYNGMILFAVLGVCVNLGAAIITQKGDSHNQKAVNLHMLEDCLGWGVVLIGAVVMRFTNFALIDPILSVAVSLFVLVSAAKNLREVADLLLEKVPSNIEIADIKEHIEAIDGVLNVHHIHIWSLEGNNNIATMHIVTDDQPHKIRDLIRGELQKQGIGHMTIEIESSADKCDQEACEIGIPTCLKHSHRHDHTHHIH